MNEFDKLRPAAREAILVLTSHFSGMHGIHLRGEWKTIRAELLRLAEENARLSGLACLICGLPNDIQCPQRNDEMSPCTFDPSPIDAAKTFLARATQAESELAALKARIAESPVGEIVPGRANSFSGFHVEIAADCLWHTSKRFRLLLDDGESA